MKTIFRADGNSDLGMGHIFRCLTLANELRDRHSNYEILFISKYEEGQRIIADRGLGVVGTQEDEVLQIRELADSGTLLITDFLDTDNAYISRIKSTTGIKVIAIDNNTRLKKLDVDMVINANVFDEGETRVIGSTRYFLGPKYVILRREFEKAHKQENEIKDEVKRILVLSGGGDFAGGQLTLNSVKALESTDEGCRIHLIMGPAFPYRDELDELLSKATRRFDVSFDPPNLLEILKSADIAITAAGTVLYELASLGIPSIAVPVVISSTSHQEDIANNFERHGACINLGKFPSNELLHEKTVMLMKDKSLRKQMSDNAKALVDGHGLERALGIFLQGCRE